VLPKNLTTAEAHSPYSQSKHCFCFSFITRERESFGKNKKTFNFAKTQEIHHQLARVRLTARITHDEEETEATETAPISEVMRRSGLVVTEGGSAKVHLLLKSSRQILKRVILVKKRLIITPLCHPIPAIWILGS
jgi:hypothetical protein